MNLTQEVMIKMKVKKRMVKKMMQMKMQVKANVGARPPKDAGAVAAIQGNRFPHRQNHRAEDEVRPKKSDSSTASATTKGKPSKRGKAR
jgi:hypothetical protein